MKRVTSFLVVSSVLMPVVAQAVTLGDTIGTLTNIVNSIIPLILAIAVLYFFWGVAQYVMNAEDSEKRGKAVSTMIMGIIAIFVMVSIWGIIGILQSTFKVGDTAPIIPSSIKR